MSNLINEEQEYTVAEAKEFLQLSTAQTCRLFKNEKIVKKGNKYTISGKMLEKIKNRKNQTTKTWMFSI